MAAEGYNQIYRQSQLGLSLQSALEDLDDQIDPSLRHKVLNHFDRVRLGGLSASPCSLHYRAFSTLSALATRPRASPSAGQLSS